MYDGYQSVASYEELKLLLERGIQCFVNWKGSGNCTYPIAPCRIVGIHAGRILVEHWDRKWYNFNDTAFEIVRMRGEIIPAKSWGSFVFTGLRTPEIEHKWCIITDNAAGFNGVWKAEYCKLEDGKYADAFNKLFILVPTNLECDAVIMADKFNEFYRSQRREYRLGECSLNDN